MRARSPSPLTASASILVAALALAGCDSRDGRELPAPDPDQTTTTAAAPVIDAPPSDAVPAFTLSSPAFTSGGELPARFTCTATPGGPPMSWTSAPPAAELALVVADDTDGTPIWVVAGLDPVSAGFGEGLLPETAVSNGWQPPCPADGTTHTYTFVLHALAEPLGLAPGTPDAQARALIEGASIDAATLTATVASAG